MYCLSIQDSPDTVNNTYFKGHQVCISSDSQTEYAIQERIKDRAENGIIPGLSSVGESTFPINNGRYTGEIIDENHCRVYFGSETDDLKTVLRRFCDAIDNNEQLPPGIIQLGGGFGGRIYKCLFAFGNNEYIIKRIFNIQLARRELTAIHLLPSRHPNLLLPLEYIISKRLTLLFELAIGSLDESHITLHTNEFIPIITHFARALYMIHRKDYCHNDINSHFGNWFLLKNRIGAFGDFGEMIHCKDLTSNLYANDDGIPEIFRSIVIYLIHAPKLSPRDIEKIDKRRLITRTLLEYKQKPPEGLHLFTEITGQHIDAFFVFIQKYDLRMSEVKAFASQINILSRKYGIECPGTLNTLLLDMRNDDPLQRPKMKEVVQRLQKIKPST